MAKVRSAILDREIDTDSPDVVVELTEGLARKVAEGTKQIRDDQVEVRAGLKTATEAAENATRAVGEMEKAMAAANRKITNFPEFDPEDLGWDNTPEAFHRALMSKPNGSGPMNRLMGDLQQASDDFFLVRTILQGRLKRQMTAGELESMKSYKRVAGLRGKLLRALDSTTTGEGLEWIPTDWSAQVREKVALALRIGSFIPTYQMPTNPWIFPFESAFPDAQRVAETLTLPANPFSTTGVTEAYGAGVPTGKRTFTLKKNRALQVTSFEFAEDSLMAALPFLRARIPYAIARGREKGCINGDTASTHQDNDTVGQGSSGTAPETTIDGLRKFYLSQGTPVAVSVTATPTSADYRNLRAKMVEFGVDLPNLYWICSALGSIHMIQNTDVRTLDKFGAQATIKVGQIAEFDGSPVVLSGFMKDNLHTNGKNTAAQANNTTAIMCAHLLNWGWGEKGQRELEIDRWALTDQNALIMFDRFDLQYLGATTDKCIGAIHGIPATVT